MVIHYLNTRPPNPTHQRRDDLKSAEMLNLAVILAVLQMFIRAM